ncbi:hypothetical protein ACQ4PT_027820 [Festuca glaucescens]
MLFLLHDDGRCSMMNTFSSDVSPLPELAALLKAHGVESTRIIKVVMSSSAPRLVAVLFSAISGSSRVLASTCRPDGKIVSCQVLKGDRYMDTILDIAIWMPIHATTRDAKLIALQLSDHEERPCFCRRILCASLPPTPSPGIYEVRRYLVESNSMLLMVWRWVSKNRFSETAGRACELSVVEADLSSGRWNKVDGLEGQALFVSRLCSKSVPAAAAAAGGHGAQQDCIYFLDEHGLGDSGAYSMGDGTITPLLPGEPATPLPSNSPWADGRVQTWFFPVEV